MSRVALALALALPIASLSACASSAVNRAATSAELSAEDAEKIVEAYRTRHERRAANPSPLREPKSLDEALEILRLDEIALFPGAVKFALAEGSPKGKALAAQILLAWGDAQHLLGDLLTQAAQDLRNDRERLERRKAAGKLAPADEERLAQAQKTLSDLEGVERALHTVGNRHIGEGMAIAEKLIAEAPKDYEGYRVAADYYHQKEDWAKFDEMVKKIEALNPQSNGLVFLKAERARDLDQNHVEAARLFKDAVSKDPKFTRAQVGLLVVQPDTSGAYAELQKLKEINPNHQIVQWMGPTLERVYQEQRKINHRRRMQLFDRATPVGN